MIGLRPTLGLFLAALALAPRAAAQPTGTIPSVFDGVGIAERLGERVPEDIAFLDDRGTPVTLGTYFASGRPVLLNLVYHECPMLCSLLLTELTKTLRRMEWTPGVEYEVVTVSISPTETPEVAARAKEVVLRVLGKPGAETGWHFLTGDASSIARLAAAVGFRYEWVESSGEFAHPAAQIFLSPEGTVTRYIHGIGYETDTLRKALVEASEGRVGTALDQILMYCYRYDPAANSYVLAAENLMRLGGLVALAVVVAILVRFWRRERGRLASAAD